MTVSQDEYELQVHGILSARLEALKNGLKHDLKNFGNMTRIKSMYLDKSYMRSPETEKIFKEQEDRFCRYFAMEKIEDAWNKSTSEQMKGDFSDVIKRASESAKTPEEKAMFEKGTSEWSSGYGAYLTLNPSTFGGSEFHTMLKSIQDLHKQVVSDLPPRSRP